MSAPYLKQRLSAFVNLTDDEFLAFDKLAGVSVEVPVGGSIRGAFALGSALYFLREGWAASCIESHDGSRQIVKLHLPGDVVGGSSLPFERAPERLIALTPVRVGLISLEQLANVFVDQPRVAALLFLQAQEDSGVLMDRLFTLGRLDAKERMAFLFLHLRERIARGRAAGLRFEVPLTQRDLADILGLTPVYVNRVLQDLEQEDLVSRTGRMIQIHDLMRLTELASISPRKVRRDQPWLPARLAADAVDAPNE